MFRITRGHHVQHIHFPLPVLRSLDALDEEADDGSPPHAAAPGPAGDATAEAGASARTPAPDDPRILPLDGD